MEMEFKDNSRRRTLVLVVGVLLALGAGAAAFMLSSQNAEAPVETIPTHEVVVAAQLIEARKTIALADLTLRSVVRDASNESAFTDPDLVAQKIAAIAIVANQPITPNMLEGAISMGQVNILEPDETVSPDSPVYRAVSLTVPADRAVGGLIGPAQRVDIFATMMFPDSAPIDPETGEIATDPETGDPLPYITGFSTKPMWLDIKVLQRTEGSDTYVMRMDMKQAEEVALAQIAGAQFSLVLRPGIDTRDLDRSAYGETVDRFLTRYNFAIPESIDGTTYEQPVAFPTPFPAEPYLELASPPPSPEDILIEIPVDAETESPAPEESPLP